MSKEKAPIRFVEDEGDCARERIDEADVRIECEDVGYLRGLEMTKWPEAAPYETKTNFLSIVCGKGRIRWAFHRGADMDCRPIYIWSTTPLCDEDFSPPKSESEILSRFIPDLVHQFIFGNGSLPSKESAEAQRVRRGGFEVNVYLVSSDSIQAVLLNQILRGVPCRVHLMKPDDFFTQGEGRKDGMAVDRLANLLGAAARHGHPSLVFDASPVASYIATDASGNIIGGGIGPGLFPNLQSILHSEHQISPIQTSDILHRLAKNARPLPVFSRDPKEAVMATVLTQLALKARTVLQHWLDLLDTKHQPSNNNKINKSRTVLLTGPDGHILNQLLQPDRADLFPKSTKFHRPYNLKNEKHLIHYGITSALMNQVRIRRTQQKQLQQQRFDNEQQKILKINDQALGKRVAKRLSVKPPNTYAILRGTVMTVQYRDTSSASPKPLFLVKYDNNTSAYISAETLTGMLELFRKVGEIRPTPTQNEPNKPNSASPKRPPPAAASSSQRETQTKRPKPDNNNKQSPLDFVGMRIAKNFAGNIYFGSITKYESEDGEDEGLWRVEYDDGDEEDFDKTDVNQSLALYQKEKKHDSNPDKKVQNQLNDQMEKTTNNKEATSPKSQPTQQSPKRNP